MKHKNCDVIIIGGGTVGLAMSCDLGRQGFDVALIDKSSIGPSPMNHEAYDRRVFAINKASTNYFKSLQVWSDIARARLCPYKRMRVWDSQSHGVIHFDARELAQANLGYIIESSVMNNALFSHIQDMPNIEILGNTHLARVQKSAIGMSIIDVNNTTIEAPLLIAADGANSWTSQQLGYEYFKSDYQHHAVIANVKTSQPHQFTAWQVFTDIGPLAFLPLADDHHCSIVWSVPPHEAQQIVQSSEDDFCNRLGVELGHTLGDVQTCSQRQSYPLIMRHIKKYVAPHVAFIGDAAHTIHPMAGQGMNLGLADAHLLGQIIKRACIQRKPFHAYSSLRGYERKRKYEVWRMISGLQGLHHCFSLNKPQPFVWLRGQGMTMLSDASMMKQWVMRQAIGD